MANQELETNRINRSNVLLVDDEVGHLRTLERLFIKEGFFVYAAESGEEALDMLREHEVDLVITDLMMPGMSGIDLLKLVRSLRPHTETILMTAFGTVETAVQGMREGAYDFITKPIKSATILKSSRQALERKALVAENRKLRAEIAELRNERAVVGQAPAFREAFELVQQVATSDATVLLTGESGTGKELFARMIYEWSERADKPFVAVNCAAIPESILESELFGYEKGAFTGANARKMGKFEAADGGTIFLDEIGELSPQVQAKLLRVLQESEFDRVGATQPTKINIRVVAATNRDLEDEMSRGTFREDLFYRLNVISINIPALRERMQDVPLLAEHFLQKKQAKNRKSIAGITAAAMQALANYRWPGNVRELENVIERAVVLDKDNVIDVDDLPNQISDTPTEASEITIAIGTTLSEIERRVIEETLLFTDGDKTLAAKLLGIATRTIYRKI